MNHFPIQSQTAAPQVAGDALCPLTPPAEGSDEEPDSPGPIPRSPQSLSGTPAADDPLQEIASHLGGVGLALLSVLVPAALVIADPARGSLLTSAWQLEIAGDLSVAGRIPPFRSLPGGGASPLLTAQPPLPERSAAVWLRQAAAAGNPERREPGTPELDR